MTDDDRCTLGYAPAFRRVQRVGNIRHHPSLSPHGPDPRYVRTDGDRRARKEGRKRRAYSSLRCPLCGRTLTSPSGLTWHLAAVDSRIIDEKTGTYLGERRLCPALNGLVVPRGSIQRKIEEIEA